METLGIFGKANKLFSSLRKQHLALTRFSQLPHPGNR